MKLPMFSMADSVTSVFLEEKEAAKGRHFLSTGIWGGQRLLFVNTPLQKESINEL